MTALTSLELWAERGNPWNTPNHQHRASPNEFRTVKHRDGSLERVPHDEVDGYDDWAIALNPRRAESKVPLPPEKRRKLDPADRLRANRLIRINRRRK